VNPEKLLFVDDDPRILAGFRRQLRGRFEVETDESPTSALEKIVRDGPFAVVVSDMRMPGPLNGAAFLAKVRQSSPHSIRVMLTGETDLGNAIKAVNEGAVFRFLTKPCATEDMIHVLDTGLQQYRLLQTERELLDKTLVGAANLLAEALSIVNPAAFNRTSNIKRYAEGVADRLALADRWQIRLAASVALLGCIAVPAEVLEKRYGGAQLSPQEMQMLLRHPGIAGRLLENIPRLEKVAQIVARQMRPGDAAALTENPADWDPVDAGAIVVNAAIEFDRCLQIGSTPEEAAASLRGRFRTPEPVLAALLATHSCAQTMVAREVLFERLAPGMVLDEDVRTTAGACLLGRGHEITAAMLERLANFREGVGLQEPLKVLAPEAA
jgi:FixJ family two-component response regulator